MEIFNLFRFYGDDEGTLGICTNGIFHFKTLELPWLDNRRNISCIYPGRYFCKIRYSRKYKIVYELTKVQNRTHILIHNGNFAGDREKGFKTHSYGCIIIGSKFGFLKHKNITQRAVLNSRITLRKFMNYMQNEEFILNIRDMTYEIKK